MTILIFFIILGVLVIAHELGHFTVAKLARVKVLEFGVGYPPRIVSITRGDTTYSLNLLPLGGFVRMLGEEDPTDPRSFASKVAWKRLAVLMAGPAMNALLPVVLLTSVFMLPQPILVADVAVLDVAKDSPAEIGGVLPGDLVRMANGRHIDNSADLRTAIQLRLGTDITWIVERGGQLRELVIPEARIDPPPGQGATGIMLTDARLTVNTVEPGSTADLVGVKSGDLLLRIGSGRVLEVADPVNVSIAMLQDNPEKAVTIDVRRDQKIITLRLTPELGHLSGLSLNAYPDAVRSQSLVSAFLSSLRGITDIFLTVRNEISRWIAGASTIELAGPVGIAQITGDVARLGISPLITWTALLSLNLAIINLLPLPALDGGRITFVLLELARGGRRLAPDKERLVHLVGFMALIGAIIVISINDIRRLVADA